ncbi:MAG: hypothetical protein WC666_04480 [Candidatus Paceibacterota bacterium]|jgi:hypothetical protein
MNRSYIFLITISCLLSFSIANAQGLPVSGDSLDLSASTNNPIPGQAVTITVRSFSVDINGAKIIWTINGKEEQSGVGITTLDVTAPALGKKTTVNVSAITTSGVILTNSIDITSGMVDMILENNGYVHPFFKGKVPLAYQNTVTIIAVPHIANSSGVEYDPKSLVYTWKKNSRVIEDQSGYGKQSIQLVGDIVPREYTLTVTITTRDSSAQAAGYASISFNSPSISFYVNDPLYGTFFNKSVIGNLRVGSQRETGILAVPFGFSKPSNGVGSLLFTWIINGIEHAELATKESIIMRVPGDVAGSSDISLEIKNNKQILQNSKSNFSVSFIANTQKPATEPVTF